MYHTNCSRIKRCKQQYLSLLFSSFTLTHLSKQPTFGGEVGLNESYLSDHRKDKRGRDVGGNVAVFGFLKRNGRVYTVAVPNAQTATLLLIIRKKANPDRIVYTDFYRSYDVLDVSEFNRFRINHSTHSAKQ